MAYATQAQKFRVLSEPFMKACDYASQTLRFGEGLMISACLGRDAVLVERYCSVC